MKSDSKPQICAIHQPNFFPWLGYFNKIYNSNTFVLLDNVLKSGHNSWGNRVSVIVAGKPLWITGSIVHKKYSQMICEVELDYSSSWQQKIEKTLVYNYKKAKYYEEVMEYIVTFLKANTKILVDLNESFIRKTCEMLHINTDILNQSNLHTKKKSTELLIEITKLVDCNVYMCGGGSSEYQEDILFEECGIQLKYQNFNHPIYTQFSDSFIEGQSIIDALFHCGFSDTENLIKRGQK